MLVDATSGTVRAAAPAAGAHGAQATATDVTRPRAPGGTYPPGEDGSARDRPALDRLYGTFEPLNSDIKALITAWQLGASQPSARQDALRRLFQAHRLALPLLREIEGTLPGLAGYQSRLCAAADRIAAGDDRYVAGLFVDSYHTIWFELHRKLLGLPGAGQAPGDS